MKHESKNFFWASYADLMTALFAATLALFVVSFHILQKQKEQILADKKKYDKIVEIENSLKSLDAKYFEYEPLYKRHKLKIDVQFEAGSNEIPNQYHTNLQEAGKAIQRLIDKAEQLSRKNQMQISYLLIIEGSASRDNYQRNFELSYARALALRNLWKNNNINFDTKYCETVISGSGIEGIGREPEMIGNEKNPKNQRFLIQIIPKIGKI